MPFGLNIHCKAFPREKRKLLRTAQCTFKTTLSNSRRIISFPKIKISPPPLPGKEFTFTFGVNIYPFSKGK